jgi:hypothetical protein
VVANDGLGDPPDQRRVTLRVDALAAHKLAQVLVELRDQLRAAWVVAIAAPFPRCGPCGCDVRRALNLRGRAGGTSVDDLGAE